jgi:ATP/maltotriose-dependent transcriptional regulator MalT
VVAIFAPAGYGKTMLLSQAAEADVRPFACIALEDGDNDPVVRMTHLAEGLDRMSTVGPAVFEAPGLCATVWLPA